MSFPWRDLTPRAGATAALVALAALALSACGGGSSSPGLANSLPTGSNVARILVNVGAVGVVNLPMVSVTICPPGTGNSMPANANCQTVDNILVDTGSTGLRVMASVLASYPALPQATTGGGNPPVGDPLYECLQFADGSTWGSVRSADVQVANGIARSIPIQVITDPTTDQTVPPVPAACSNGSPPENTVQQFGANGVLGISYFSYDCPTCINNGASVAGYYGCATNASCDGLQVNLPANQQVQNPVFNFAPPDNNGVRIVLPNPGSSSGQSALAGALVLGINTQANNQLGTAVVLAADPVQGLIRTTYKGVTLPMSFIDSGSNALFFADASITACTATATAGFYCPATVTSLNASNQGYLGTGASSAVSFSVANADALFNTGTNFVLPNLAATNTFSGSFDWGLPFFFGRSVYFGFEAPAGTGPYVAYAPF